MLMIGADKMEWIERLNQAIDYIEEHSLYNEICEGNPYKMQYKFDNRLEWGLKQNRK